MGYSVKRGKFVRRGGNGNIPAALGEGPVSDIYDGLYYVVFHNRGTNVFQIDAAPYAMEKVMDVCLIPATALPWRSFDDWRNEYGWKFIGGDHPTLTGRSICERLGQACSEAGLRVGLFETARSRHSRASMTLAIQYGPLSKKCEGCCNDAPRDYEAQP